MAEDEDIESLLTQLELDKDLEDLERLLSKFNIFEAIDVVRQERFHSDFLAFLLNPRESHGMGDAFIKGLLQIAVGKASKGRWTIRNLSPDKRNFEQTLVLRESRNIDILLADEANKLAIIIENKIDSSEHDDQLQRYYNIVRHDYYGWFTFGLYLTPEGDLPTHEDYIAIDYSSVCRLLEDLAQSYGSTLDADVHTFISHYTKMLRRYIVGKSEIEELCRRLYRDHQIALDQIYEYRLDRQTDIAESLKSLIPQGPRLALDDCTKQRIRFSPLEWDVPIMLEAKGGTSSGRVLLFEFVNRPKELFLRLSLDKGPQETRDKLWRMAHEGNKKTFIERTRGNEPPTIYYKQFLTATDFKKHSNEDLFKIISKKWGTFVKSDLARMRAIMLETSWAYNWKMLEKQESLEKEQGA